MQTILLTGGAGFIGSHTAVVLLEAGYDVVIADNFSNSEPAVIEAIGEIAGRKAILRKMDLRDEAALNALFEEFHIDAVVHFAGYKAVGESVEKPLMYYENNILATLRLLEAMQKHGVNKFVFSSSATVYSSATKPPYAEDAPLGASNPYGQTKLFIEQILKDLCIADEKFAAVLLRYFNPIGAHPSGLIGEDPRGIPNNLVPYVAKVAMGELPFVRIWGDDYDTPDGTGVRDYIHVLDLARGHLLALKYIENRAGAYPFNLGTGRGYSVKEVIAAYQKACGHALKCEICPRRAGDLATVYADVALAKKELGFEATRGLSAMCRDSFKYSVTHS